MVDQTANRPYNSKVSKIWYGMELRALDSSNLDKYWPEGIVNVTCNKCGQYKEGEQNRRQEIDDKG